MKLIIDISQDCYDYWCEKKGEYAIADALINGIPYEEKPKGDLISREALKKCAIPCEIHNGALTDLCVPLYQINNAPTVEPIGQIVKAYTAGFDTGVETVKRPKGEWIIVKDEKWGDNVKCPFCGKELAGTDLNFCCKCGAKLIGSEKMNGGAE